MNITNTNAHLTYCLNVHPGGTPEELQAAVFERAPEVFARLRELGGVDGPHGLGLWLSSACAEWLLDEDRRADFANRLQAAGMYVFTVNGFPFGAFHGRRIKQDVYSPDWSDPARLEHTVRLGTILSDLLPAGETGTISTVPVTYRAWAEPPGGGDRVRAATANLIQAVAEFAQLEERTGRRIQLLLEPEPDCLLDDPESVISFFRNLFIPALNERFGSERGAEILQRHFGICLDLAHTAVVFADPADMLARFCEHDIPVGKLHLSAAVKTRTPGRAPTELRSFIDEVYLHQTRVRTPQTIHAFRDLPEALDTPNLAGEWGVHYHVPLVWEGTPGLTSSRDLITPDLLRAALNAGVRHFEVETYTLSLFGAGEETPETVLARELLWARDRFPV
ncbi:MAG: metabolite traffic protein EboE [Verrucomicrobiota bacterium]